MSSQATSSRSKKRGRGQNKRVWTREEDGILVTSLLEIYHDPHWRADNGFKSGYLMKLQGMIEAKLPGRGILANPHIESRIKTLKKQYVLFADALCQSGFGWNAEKMMLECDRDVFDAWAKNKRYANALYGKPFEHYYSLGEIYGKDCALGTNAGNVEDDEEEIREQDASVNQEGVRVDDFFEQLEIPTDFSQYGGSNVSASDETEIEYVSLAQPSPPPPPPKPSTGQQRPTQKRSAEDAVNVPNSSCRKARALDDMAKKFGQISESIAAMAPKFGGLIDVLSTEKEIADMQSKLRGEIRKMDFLTPAQVFQITNKLAKDHDMLRVFFSSTDEEKKDYIISFLQYGC